MERNQNCRHAQDEMCSCITGMSTVKQLVFFASNIRGVSWELDYATLASPGSVRLCIAGTCGECGKRLCCCILDDISKTGNSLLESVYAYIDTYDKLGGLRTDRQKFDADFLCLFHKQDWNLVRRWLETGSIV